MNCIAKNAAVCYRHYSLLLLFWGLCAAIPITAQTIIQTPAQADSLRRVIATAKHDTTRVSAMNALSYYYDNVSINLDSAIVLAREAEQLALQTNFRNGQASALNNIGNVFLDKGKYADALQYYFSSLRIREALGDKAGTAQSFNSIGLVYRLQGKLNEALESFRKARVFHESAGNKRGIATVMNNIAGVYYYQKKYRESLESHQNSLRISEELGNKQGMAQSLNNIAEIYFQQGNYDESFEFHNKSLSIFEAIDDRLSVAIVNVNIANIHWTLGRFEQALIHAKYALLLADSLGTRETKQIALGLLANIYESLGQHKQSLAYHKQYMTLKDSLVNLENLNKSTQLKESYEAEKREQQIALQQSELGRKNVVQLILIGVLVAAVIIAFWFRSLYQNKNRANAEILRQQQTLENQALEIELANTTLHERNFLLEELDREKNEFLGIAAHDLKNPLASIRVIASMLQRYGGQLTAEKQHESLERILTVVERMMTIITNLLDINILERREIQLHILNVDIFPLVEAAVNQYRAPAEAKNITLHFINNASESIVSADEQALVQVLDNIISNAVKYSPHGKNVFVCLKASTDKVRVEVQDEGEGISPDDMKKLFGKFARLSARPTGGEHSTGLGLSIVKKMVEAMNGRVWCESEVGKGATFIVELPAEPQM
ncbi:MAG: tetratricopeptide repeat-containing sensor histidine kinase [Candidatus Kapaibacteriota bacterium]